MEIKLQKHVIRYTVIGILLGVCVSFVPGYLMFLLFSIAVVWATKKFSGNDFKFLMAGVLIAFVSRIAAIIVLEFVLVNKDMVLRMYGYDIPQLFPDTQGGLKSMLHRLLKEGVFYKVCSYQIPALFGDSGYYALRSWWMARSWMGHTLSQGIISEINRGSYGSHGYLYIIANIYYFFGFDTILSRVSTSFFGILTAVSIYFTAKIVTGRRRTSRYTFILVAFWPMSFLWSLTHLKDTFLAFIIVVFILCLFLFYRSKTVVKLVFFAAALVLLLIFANSLRLYLALVLFVPFFVGFLYAVRSHIIRWSFLLAVLFLGVSISRTFVGADILSREYNNLMLRHKGSVRTGGNVMGPLPEKYYIKWGTYDPENKYYAYHVPGWVAVKGCLKMFFSLFVQPLPDRMGSGLKRIGFSVYMFAWYVILLQAIGGFYLFMRDKVKRRDGIVLLSFIVVVNLYIITGTANIGTILRWKSMFEPFIFIFAAYWFDVNFEKIKKSKILMLLAGK